MDTGEFVALLGPNGAGKTTFLRILASLSLPTLGEVWISGHPLPSQAAAVRRRLGVVSHLPLLYGDLTAEENLRFFGRMYSISELNQRVSEVLELVGLSARRRELVRTFSRGMQQRLAIGRAVLHDPDVMLFDEPHTGLDQDASAMLDHVLREVAAMGRTVVMTSHDLARLSLHWLQYKLFSKVIIENQTDFKCLMKTYLPSFMSRLLLVLSFPTIDFFFLAWIVPRTVSPFALQ